MKNLNIGFIITIRILGADLRVRWSGQKCEFAIVNLIFSVAPKAPKVPCDRFSVFLRPDPIPLA